MASRGSRWLVYGQLLRLPNVFTAVADPLAGWLVVGGGGPVWQLPALAGASACLYTAGIVLNDCFDYEHDRIERPERPLPRGVVSRGAACGLGSLLMLAGLALAALVGGIALSIAGSLGFLIMLYNAWAKRFPVLGPLVLGCCRFGNFLLGMRALPPKLWLAPVILGVYVSALSLIARHEAGRPPLLRAVRQLLLGIIAVDALLVLASPHGDWVGAALVLSLLLPAVVLSRTMPMT